MRFPFAERAALSCHAEFSPSAASALAAAACFVECLCVPFGAGFARCFAGGECFGWGGGEAAAGEAMRGLAEFGKSIFAKCNDVLWEIQEKVRVTVAFSSSKETQSAG